MPCRQTPLLVLPGLLPGDAGNLSRWYGSRFAVWICLGDVRVKTAMITNISRARILMFFLGGVCVASSSPQISATLVGHFTVENDRLREDYPQSFRKNCTENVKLPARDFLVFVCGRAPLLSGARESGRCCYDTYVCSMYIYIYIYTYIYIYIYIYI